MKKNRTLISAQWVLPITDSPIRDGAVVLEGDRILAVGKQAELEKKYAGVRRKKFPRSILLPGFVNAHSHLAYTTLPVPSEIRHFPTWLEKMVSGLRENSLSEKEFLASCRVGVREGMRSGITTFADSGPSAAALQALEEAGARGIFYREIFSFTEQDRETLVRRTVDKIHAARKSLPPRLQAGISPHSPYTTPPALLQAFSRACAEHRIPFTFHVAESPAETEFFQQGEGALARIFPGREKEIPRARSPVRYLNQLGILGNHLLAAHCVQVDHEDRELLSQTKVRIAYCPTSNAWLDVGQPPVAELLRRGVPIGLGTDSAASAGTLNFFATLRDAVLLGKLSPTQVLEMATLGGAAALGLENQIGSLEPGKKADLIAVTSPSAAPQDPFAHLALHAHPDDVSLVLVDGCPLVEKYAIS